MSANNKNKVTVHTLRAQKRKGVKTVLTTCYDYPQAIISDNANVDAILVGDSLGMTTLGYDSTLPVTMDDMIRSAKAVARGNKRAFLIGDMPYMSYQASDADAVRNAGRFIRVGMDCIKLEGVMTDRIKAISDAGIMVMGHLGLTPQTKAKLGGYKVQGKTAKQAELILDEAKQVQDAGCSFLLLEGMPRESAEIIAKELTIPVYGIGAGDYVDGQLLILHDMLGLFWDFKPKFAKRYCEAGQIMCDALKTYAKEVREGIFPGEENFYEIKDSEKDKLVSDKE